MKPNAAVPRSIFLLAILVLLLLPARLRVEAAPVLSAGLDELQPTNPAAFLQYDPGTDDPGVDPDPQCHIRRRAFLPIVAAW